MARSYFFLFVLTFFSDGIVAAYDFGILILDNLTVVLMIYILSFLKANERHISYCSTGI